MMGTRFNTVQAIERFYLFADPGVFVGTDIYAEMESGLDKSVVSENSEKNAAPFVGSPRTSKLELGTNCRQPEIDPSLSEGIER